MDRSESWVGRGEAYGQEFEHATPFPLVVIDDFLSEDHARALLEEFPPITGMPRSRDYMFGDKHELSSVAANGPASAAFFELALSGEFREFLCALSGDDVFVDPAFHGGGFHQGGDGSFLDMHVDFNVHPEHEDWLRTLNVLVYLNPDWDDSWGGQLLVKNAPEGEVRRISPKFNRAVIMRTNDHTFHGYRKMALPPGVTRRSIATYAYTAIEPGAVQQRTTNWVPEGAGPLKRLLASNYNTLVQAKNKLFGSATSKNR
ncbi:MAG TPA: 2OG-Fe(II) oxygenase [Acidimicrobiales bacterium]|nr:2OG-Fe(II) oxygenase [Acidimicrobiales bacterium]